MKNQEFTPWPCSRLAKYPLREGWNDYFPSSRLSRVNYVCLTQAIQSLFLMPSFESTYSEMRDYAWQQGGLTNANAIDKEFFFNMLTHDYPFLIGHKGVELGTSFSLDSKKYEGMDHLRASHFDLYRVVRSNLGVAELQSLLHEGQLYGYFSLTDYPRDGEYVLARILPVGMMPRRFAYTVVEPWDTIDPRFAEDVVRICKQQYLYFKDKYPQSDARAFMKVAAYFVYELIQSYELVEKLNGDLHRIGGMEGEEVCAVTTRFTYPKASQMMRIDELPGAKFVVEGGETNFNLATAPISADLSIPETLREAILSRESNSIEVTTFLKSSGERYIESCMAVLPHRDKMVRHTQYLDNNVTYRALRHLF